MRSCVILGSGRSGTSMVAGTLHAAGYHMGEDLIPPTSSNPKGYFEDRAVNEINEDLLVQLVALKPSGRRGCLYPPRRLAYGHRWLASVDLTATVHATPDIAARMRSLTCARPFCFKDPRFCYTLNAWRPVLEDAVFVCVFREPGRTAASMVTDTREREYLKHLRLSRRRGLQVWSLMYEHVLQRHRHLGQWLFVHYDQFLDGSAISPLETLLDTPIDSNFADPRLKRSTTASSVPKRTASLYRQLCALARFDPGEPSDARAAESITTDPMRDRVPT